MYIGGNVGISIATNNIVWVGRYYTHYPKSLYRNETRRHKSNLLQYNIPENDKRGE